MVIIRSQLLCKLQDALGGILDIESVSWCTDLLSLAIFTWLILLPLIKRLGTSKGGSGGDTNWKLLLSRLARNLDIAARKSPATVHYDEIF